MLYDKPFTKENLDKYLRELAKEFRKRNGKDMPAEIILVGGAAVVVNYGFREMTYDMDVIVQASSVMKDAINVIGDRYDLPNGWMNEDFKKTKSYSPQIVKHAKYYRTFSNILTVRTIAGEYLVAMKMRAGREYKYDRSDIVGVLLDQERMGDSLTLDRIQTAVRELYGSYEVIDDEVRKFLEQILQDGNYKELYRRVRQIEIENRENLLEYQDEKPGAVNTDNVRDVLAALRNRKEKKEQ